MHISRTNTPEQMKNVSLVKLSQAFSRVPMSLNFYLVYFSIETLLLERISAHLKDKIREDILELSEIADCVEAFASMGEGSTQFYQHIDKLLSTMDLSDHVTSSRILWAFAYAEFHAKMTLSLIHCINLAPVDQANAVGIKAQWALGYFSSYKQEINN